MTMITVEQFYEKFIRPMPTPEPAGVLTQNVGTERNGLPLWLAKL